MSRLPAAARARAGATTRAVSLAAFLSCSLAGCQPAAEAPPPAAKPPSAMPAPKPAPAVPLVSGLPDFSALVQQVGPAVVNIKSVSHATEAALDPDDPFAEFLKRFGMQPPRGDVPAQRGEGSGFIVATDGIILTNAHVVGSGDELTVRLTDRREFTAKVIGVDKRTDVAVLKIEAKDLPTVRIGQPEALRPGQWVLAIGSPFGFDNSVTAGIVSATARSLPDETFTPFIQTDVAVNPGNSGGPLFNLAGEVVGINSQIYSRTGGYMGVSFAIPIDLAVHVKDQLVTTGKVRRGRMGVTIQDVNQQFADSFGLDRPRGALVSAVEKGAPADRAGLVPGDVILELNGMAIDRSSELPSRVSRLEPGTEATLTVWRDKASKSVRVKLGELDEPVQKVAQAVAPGAGGKLGLGVRALTAAERKSAGVAGGLLVESVAGPAAEAGVEAGDIILGVNGRRVTSPDQLQQAAAAGGRRTLALLVQRGGSQLFVPLKPAG